MDQVVIGNVTFEPGCRNNWHIHHADKGGGQILLVTGGRGYYQEWGKPARELHAGDVVNIPAGVKHWHGAAPTSWFAHLAIEVPGENTKSEWEDMPCTVIVLGCQVLEDGRPSLMLQKRIDAAYGYLSAHPDAACVASGGLDDSETVTEAQCIRSTLVSMGIDEGRIYLEDRSRSTEENLSFSAAIIREQSLPQQAVIASDNFHQLRAAILAERDGLTPYAAGCASPWFLTAGYWAREEAALLCMAVTGM